jgi:hypothetical protein
MKRMLITTAILVAIAGPAAAEGRCNQPYAPVIKITASTTAQEIATLRGDVQSFMAASDIYQQCIIASNGGNDRRVQANQAQKVRVGQQFNEIVRTYKK